jgi:KaiC/GvpD/RAD55 family RecA-like ATPase
MDLRVWSNRAITFLVVAVLSGLLLTLFPFYPLYITIVLALVLGGLAIEFPSLSLPIAVLLSVIGALYQNAYIGLTYLVVFVLFVALGQTWVELALLSATWVLVFSPLPPLAIIPTVIAGLHSGRQTAVKIGLLSSITVFLLAWAMGMMKAGFFMIASPASVYVPKPIPEPWHFDAFLPNLGALLSPQIGSYFAPLGPAIGDFRLYVIVAAWAVGGYLIALLVPRFRKLWYLPASIVGVLPLLIVSFIFTGISPIDIGIAFVGVVVVTVAYKFVQSVITGPALGYFTKIEDLVPSGIPQKYSVLLGAPVGDERNLVIEEFLQTGFKTKSPCFMLTTDLDFARNSISKYGEKLTVLVANPRAETISGRNVVAIPTGIQNLTTLNIELVKVVRNVASTGGKVCLDVLSDILLTHKMLTTRKWVTDLVPRLDEWGFSVLGAYNPVLHSNEDVRGLMDLFKGDLEISEKDFAGKKRKVIMVRKMTDLQFSDGELLLDAQMLRKKEAKGLRGRLAR